MKTGYYDTSHTYKWIIYILFEVCSLKIQYVLWYSALLLHLRNLKGSCVLEWQVKVKRHILKEYMYGGGGGVKLRAFLT